MNMLAQNLKQIQLPDDYFGGVGKENRLPTPTDILLFVRHSKSMLQQQALQNRSHHRYVLVLNLGTQGKVHVDHITFTFREGEALLIHPYQFHHFSHLESSELRWLVCTFELTSTDFLMPFRNRVFPTGAQSHSSIEDVVAQWLETTQSSPSDEGKEMLLQTACMRLLIHLEADLRTTSIHPPIVSADSLVNRINKLLMRETQKGPVTVAQLAERLHLSESGLRTKFKRTAGISLGSYIQNYRINRAMALLRTTDLSIAAVSEEAGFGSPQAFCRTFKSETGQSPRDHRRS
ncbi:helix-turn-helix transcriptional regulator [Kiritimatiellota bacterium B12222]|nr:helix-turn-helix transcriptional regulator [Kiritimatiellota bacterium B12222]